MATTPVQQPGIYMNVSSTGQYNSVSPSQQSRNRLSFPAVSPDDLPRCDLPPDPLQRIKKKYFDRQMSGGALSLELSQQANKYNLSGQLVSVVPQDIVVLQQDKLKLQQQQQSLGYSSNVIGANQNNNTSSMSISPNNRSRQDHQSTFLKQTQVNHSEAPMNPLRKLVSKPLLSRGRTNGNSEELNQTANIIMPMSQLPVIGKCISLERTTTAQVAGGELQSNNNYPLSQVDYPKQSQQYRQSSLQGNINDNLMAHSFSPISQAVQGQQQEFQSQFNGITQLKEYSQQQQKQMQDPQQQQQYELRYFQSNHSVPAVVGQNQNPYKPSFILARQLLQPGEQSNNKIRQTPSEVFLSQNVPNSTSIITSSTVPPNYLSVNQQVPKYLEKSQQQQQQQHQQLQYLNASNESDPPRPVNAPQFRPISSNKLQQVNPSWSEAPTLSLHPTITTPTISPRGKSALDDSPAIPPSEHTKISIIPVTFLASSEHIQTKEFSVIPKPNQTTMTHSTVSIALATKGSTLAQYSQGDFITVDAPQSNSMSSNSIGGHGAVSSSVCEVPIERSDNSLPEHLQTIDVAAEDVVTSGEHKNHKNIHNTSRDQYEHQHIKVITQQQQQEGTNIIGGKSRVGKKGRNHFKTDPEQGNQDEDSSSSSEDEIDKEINKQFHYHYNYLSGNETLQADASEIKTSSQEERSLTLRQATNRQQEDNTGIIQHNQVEQTENTFQIGNTSYVIPPYVEYKRDTKLRMQILEVGQKREEGEEEGKQLSNQDSQLDKKNKQDSSHPGITLVQSIIESSQQQEGSDFIKNRTDIFKKDSQNSFFTSSTKLTFNNNMNKTNAIVVTQAANSILNRTDNTNSGMGYDKQYFNDTGNIQDNDKVDQALEKQYQQGLEDELRVKERGDSVDEYRREGMLLDLLKNDDSSDKMVKDNSNNLEKNKKELEQECDKDAGGIQEAHLAEKQQDNQRVDCKELKKQNNRQEEQQCSVECKIQKQKDENILIEEKQKRQEERGTINQGNTADAEIPGDDEQPKNEDPKKDQLNIDNSPKAGNNHSSSSNSSPTYITKYSTSNIVNESSPNTSTSNFKHSTKNYQTNQQTKSSSSSNYYNSHSVIILGHHSAVNLRDSQLKVAENSQNDAINAISNSSNNINNDHSKNDNMDECSSKDGLDNNNNYRGKGNAVTINSILRKLSSKGLLQQQQASPHTAQTQQQQSTPTINNNNNDETNPLTISPSFSEGQHEQLHSQHNSRSKSSMNRMTRSEYDNQQQNQSQKQSLKYQQKGRSYSSNQQQHSRISQNSRDIILKQFAELKRIAQHRSVSPLSAATAGAGAVELSSSSLDISATTTKTVSQKRGILHQLMQQAERPHTPSFSEHKIKENHGKEDNEEEEDQEQMQQSQSNNQKEDKQNDENSVLQPVNLHSELLNREEEESANKEQEIHDGIDIKRTESEQGIYDELSDLDKRLMAKDNNRMKTTSSSKNNSSFNNNEQSSAAGIDQQLQQGSSVSESKSSNAGSTTNGSIKEQLRRIFDAYAENSRDANARTIVELQHLINQNQLANNKSVQSAQSKSQQQQQRKNSNSLNRMPQFIQKPIAVNNNNNNSNNESNLSSYITLLHSSQQETNQENNQGQYQQKYKRDSIQREQTNGEEEEVDYANTDSANEDGKLIGEQIKNCSRLNENSRLNKSNVSAAAAVVGGSTCEDKEKGEDDRREQQQQQQHHHQAQSSSSSKKTYSVLHSKKTVNTTVTAGNNNSIHKNSYSPFSTKSVLRNGQPIKKSNNQSYQQQSKVVEIDSRNNGRRFATDLKKVQSEQTNSSFTGVTPQNQQKQQQKQQDNKKAQQFSAAQAFKPKLKKSNIDTTTQQQQQQQQQQLPEEQLQKNPLCYPNASPQDDLQELEDATKEKSFEYWAEKIKNSDNPKQILDVWKLINRTSQSKN